MYSSISNAAQQGAPASFRTQSHYGSGTANTVTSKQIFASLPRFSRNGVQWTTGSDGVRRMTSSGRSAAGIIRRTAQTADLQVNGTSRWGQHRGGGCINGASVLDAPSIIRDVTKTEGQFAISQIAPNKGEVGIPVRTALAGGADAIKTNPSEGTIDNPPSIFDVSEDLPQKWRRLDAEARELTDYQDPRPANTFQESSARVTGMAALIQSQIQGNPSTNGYSVLVRNPQMQTYLGPNNVNDDNRKIVNSLATWNSVYDGTNNVKGLPPFQHQVNPIVMRDINADFYSQLY